VPLAIIDPGGGGGGAVVVVGVGVVGHDRRLTIDRLIGDRIGDKNKSYR
jgi:hypothetical protein